MAKAKAKQNLRKRIRQEQDSERRARLVERKKASK